ncbi:MAG: hypothetical protein QM780_06990 [Hyphomicrobium sp.]|uniref:hypothetical protein n=1 Tax=Hyphomicrobium sp. TaxID=82 RepID=UPI0039E22F1D
MGGFLRRSAIGTGASLAAFAFGCTSLRADDAPASCTKEDFESVVEQAAGSLRDLNAQNRPQFQEKLRQLKEKRHWNHDEFMDKAKPFVKDDKMAVYDKTTDELLSAISSMGQEGAAADTPDCTRMVELRARMKLLVDTQSAKWNYMFQKLDGELAN